MMILNTLNQPLQLIAFVVAFLVGLTIHEYAHAWTAYRLGDDTAKLMGRLTLNPLKHLDFLGLLFILIVGVGWAKPVPYDPRNIKDQNGEIKIALSGVFANLLLALVLGAAIRIATAYGISIDSSPALSFVATIVFVNLALVAFNIIPIPPLDGSRVIESYLSFENRLKFEQIGPMILVGIIVGQQLLGFPLLTTIIEPIIRFLSFATTGMVVI
jgi:Zn-dependent protease